jgi:large subunit ribosomal protein L1
MRKPSKRYQAAAKKVDPNKRYTVAEAVTILKSFDKAKFDESVEVVMKLGIDPKQSDQVVRGAVALPKGIGKQVRVIAFASGQKAEDAKAAGADAVGSDDLVQKVTGGWTDFDVAVAAPDMMRSVGKLGRILGPIGKMPSPKSGTVTENIGQAVKEFKAGKIEFRTDTGGNVHALVGKTSFAPADLQSNIEAFISHILSLKPASAKGTYLQKAVVSATMSPGIKLAV